MNNAERSTALRSIQDGLAILRVEGGTIPWSAWSRRQVYLLSLDAADSAIRAAWFANASDEGAEYEK